MKKLSNRKADDNKKIPDICPYYTNADICQPDIASQSKPQYQSDQTGCPQNRNRKQRSQIDSFLWKKPPVLRHKTVSSSESVIEKPSVRSLVRQNSIVVSEKEASLSNETIKRHCATTNRCDLAKNKSSRPFSATLDEQRTKRNRPLSFSEFSTFKRLSLFITDISTRLNSLEGKLNESQNIIPPRSHDPASMGSLSAIVINDPTENDSFVDNDKLGLESTKSIDLPTSPVLIIANSPKEVCRLQSRKVKTTNALVRDNAIVRTIGTEHIHLEGDHTRSPDEVVQDLMVARDILSSLNNNEVFIKQSPLLPAIENKQQVQRWWTFNVPRKSIPNLRLTAKEHQSDGELNLKVDCLNFGLNDLTYPLQSGVVLVQEDEQLLMPQKQNDISNGTVVNLLDRFKNGGGSGFDRIILNNPFVDKMQLKKRAILVQMHETEESYVESLKMLVMKYYLPMKKKKMIPEHYLNIIFYKIPEIHMHHQLFMHQYDKRISNWSDSQTVGDVLQQAFSRVSVKECYLEYISNYINCQQVLRNNISSSSQLTKFLEHQCRTSEKHLNINDLLIQPIQRLPRYELFIKDLIKCTREEVEDYELLQKARQCIHDLASAVDVKKNSLTKGAKRYLHELVIQHGHHNEEFSDTSSSSSDSESDDFIYTMQAKVKFQAGRDKIKDGRLFLHSGQIALMYRKKRTVFLSRIEMDDQENRARKSVVRKQFTPKLQERLCNLEVVELPNEKSLSDQLQMASDYVTLESINQMLKQLSIPVQGLSETIQNAMTSRKPTKSLGVNEFKSIEEKLKQLQVKVRPRPELGIMTITFEGIEERKVWQNMITANQDERQILAKTTSSPG